MWWASRTTPLVAMPTLLRVGVSAAFGLIGGFVGIAGTIAFRNARTTVNPMKPANASALVTGGVYHFTRNPMYLALLFVLLGWAVFLASFFALLGALAFVLYITRFQIKPEERTLSKIFGSSYDKYMKQVRRWV
jgi:protein-S-isoprenylcysteine O-methyltransferase Ste14